ncbi:uncharacterized protein BP5553_03508 [Venustampulla echinocandica]|uniref:Uncharacterized protein n=1 Tax=Venustampulla echinocandica TaxID=2656787 RepID=A0A370TUK8_9HELO|nr:uncharacterized protein BP5553_03508 [Venustampulla echinocandica]RDL39168.1 hypothetical protein BP5553_03508 [Venustampulla echinocandica]
MAFTIYLFLAVFALLGAARAQFGDMEMFSPRFYMGSPALERRQSDGCGADAYSCLDVGRPDKCCSKDQYCLLNKNFDAECCAIGSPCDSPCPSTAYACPATITVSGTKTTGPGCCGRSCPSTSQYKCAESFGGGCCSYGFDCAPGKSCVSAARPTTSPPIVGVIPPGCSKTNQFSCASSLGGGCCDNGYSCKISDGVNGCAPARGTSMLTRTGTGGSIATQTPQDSPGGGLSTGAKAGIGVGVAVAALGVIGGLLWFCVVHRRRARQSQKSESVPAISQGGSENPPGGSKAGGSKAGGSKAGSKRPSVGRSQPSDYFGPTAIPGPFTEEHTSPGTTPGTNRGVPAVPQSPGDIASPVEIDSRVQSEMPTSSTNESSMAKGTVQHPVELP